MIARRDSFAASALAAIVCASCAGFERWPWGSPQAYPAPMESTSDTLQSGDVDLIARGPEEVLVLRHADPVLVRPAGLASGFPLTFYDKNIRVSAGSAVYSAPGGRVEVLWPNGNSVVLFGRGAGLIGSQSRGEPCFLFRQVDHARIDLRHEDQIELLGGAHLTASSGPFVVEHFRADIVRVKNQSKVAGEIAFREALFTLDPGQVIDLPLLSAGARPAPRDVALQPVKGPGFEVESTGDMQAQVEDGAVRLQGEGEHEIHGLGVRVRVDTGESVRFSGLARPSNAAKNAPTPLPAPLKPNEPAASGNEPRP